MNNKKIRLITGLLLCGLMVSGMAFGQYYGRDRVIWVDDTHYVDTQKDKDGKDVKMSVDAATGKAKIYVAKTTTPAPRVSVIVKDGELYYSDGTTAPQRQITANPGIEVNPRLSPDKKSVAFTRDNDLYVIDLTTNLERRLTMDGTKLIYNGYASWVYFEEILGRPSQYCAFYWSPDSKTIAFL